MCMCKQKLFLSEFFREKMAFVTNLTRSAFSTHVKLNAIKNFVVIGGGQMGSGIAQVGIQVRKLDSRKIPKFQHCDLFSDWP